jgi:hypothetical protein
MTVRVRRRGSNPAMLLRDVTHADVAHADVDAYIPYIPYIRMLCDPDMSPP